MSGTRRSVGHRLAPKGRRSDAKTGSLKRSGNSKKISKQRSLNAFSLNESDDGDSVNDSDGNVKPEDDEEIDSDEAFESGDEDKFDSFKFSGSTVKSAKRKRTKGPEDRNITQRPASIEVDLAEDSEQDVSAKIKHPFGKRPRIEQRSQADSDSDQGTASDFEDDLGEDLMDLSEMLNPSKTTRQGPATPDYEFRTSLHNDTMKYNNEEKSRLALNELEDTDQGATTSEDSDDDGDDDDDDDDDDVSASDSSSTTSEESSSLPSEALDNFVAQLEQKRKSSSIPEEPAPHVTHQARKSLALRPSESNERSTESEYNLSLSSNRGKLDIESMMESLTGQQGKILRKTQALQAPLAKPIQDRIDRSAAYETVKDQLTKWQPAVRQLREAAVLKFPLTESDKIQPNNNSLASTFKPANAFENEIDSILKESGMQSENSIATFEDLKMAKLSVEEVQKRRADLAIMRDLLFRQEQKAKRQSKIKSKAFRRVHRKEKEKLRLAMEEANPNSNEHLRQAEASRARERMELRHKNTGKWAQKMLERADHGEGSRAAITEQLQRGEELERKIRGLEHNGQSENSDSDQDGLPEQDEPLPDRGVFSMKFMRDADAKQARALQEDASNIDDYSQSDDPAIEQGRRVFKPIATQHAQAQAKVKARNPVHAGAQKMLPDQVQRKSTDEEKMNLSDEGNPWLTTARPTKSNGANIVHKDTNEADKFAAKLKKRKDEKRQIRQHEGRIGNLQLDIAHKLPLKDSLDEAHSSDQERDVQPVTRQTAIKQSDLVSRAFAGDDVVAEFETEKNSAILQDAPQEIDQTLPGWGSWTGEGVKKSRHSKKFVKHIPGIRSDQRQDLKLQHVIINEKRMKQAKPYMSQSVPYPYENKEQYERSLNLPIGPEFTTRTNFQKQIMPHIVKRQGKVIAPMVKPFKT